MSPKNTITKALPASMEAESKPDASETDTRVSEKPRDKKPAAKQTQPRPKQPENEPEISEYETTSESDSENKNRQSNPTRKPKTKKLAAQPRAEDAVEEDADGSARQDVVEHTKVAKKPRSKQKSSKRRKSLGKERHGFNECAQHDGKDVDQYRGINQAVEPQTGIHSQDWADSVAPQSSSLLKMPIEIRYMIFEYVISSFNEFVSIEPHRRGNVYRDPRWLTTSTETDNINLICKQLYLDIDAGGWLYRFKHFTFPGPGLLRQFLWAIKPSHKDALRSISLVLRLASQMPADLSKNALLALAELKGLQYLHLTVQLDRSLTRYELLDEASDEVYHMTEKVLKKIGSCQELRGVTGLTGFDLSVAFDKIWSNPNFVYSGRKESLPTRVRKCEEDLRKVMLRCSVYDEVRESNAKLRGLDEKKEVDDVGEGTSGVSSSSSS